MATPTPAVSVLMAVYDAEDYLQESVDSLLEQTWEDFELIIVDDASTDRTAEILDAYDDPRIVRLRNPTNRGLTASLIRAMEAARAPLVARQDADDASEPERLQRQVGFLRAHPEVDLVGTFTLEVGPDGEPIGEFRIFPSPDYVAWEMSHRNPLYHSTVLARRASLEAAGGYDARRRYAQDHDLWTRMIMSGSRCSVVPEPLVRYRRHPDQMTTSFADQLRSGLVVRQRYCSWALDRSVAEADILGMMWLLGWDPIDRPDRLVPALRLIHRLRRRFTRRTDTHSRRAVEDAVRTQLRSRARRRAEEGGYGDSALLLVHALRTGVGGPLDRRTWAMVLRIVRQLTGGRAGAPRRHVL